MAEKSLTLRELLDSLAGQGLLADAERRRIEQQGGRPAAPVAAMPWFLQVFMGAGAWLAAVFVSIFFFAADIIDWRASHLIPCGLALVAAATTVRHFRSNVFIAQLCLASSFAGHFLAIAGAGDWARLGGAAAMAAGLCAVTVPLYRDAVHRFASMATALTLLTLFVVDQKNPILFHLLMAAETAATLAIFARSYTSSKLLPLGYALAIALPASLVLTALPELEVPIGDAPSRAVVLAGLCASIAVVAGGLRGMRREPVVLAVVTAALVGVFGVSGLLAAAMLLVLGYARGDALLVGLGLVALTGFLWLYYYALSVTLLDKSVALLLSGAVLLAVRWIMLRRPWAREESA